MEFTFFTCLNHSGVLDTSYQILVFLVGFPRLSNESDNTQSHLSHDTPEIVKTQ